MMVWKKALVIGAVFSVMVSSGCKAIGSEQVTAASSTQAKVDLVDISDHWAQASIISAFAKGYVDGYPDKSFRPNLEVSRAEFIKLVVTAMKLPLEKSDGSDWYTPYVNAAHNAGLITGADVSKDVIQTPIPRSTMAKIALRATMKDNANYKPEVAEAMYKATQQGLLQGVGNGEVAPEGTTTRAQSVTIIDRILTVNNGGTLEKDKLATRNAEIAFHGTDFETMIGTNWNLMQLPATADVHSGVTATFDKIITIDCDDPSDPNRAYLDEPHFNADLTDSYAFAFHFTIDNPQAQNDNTFFEVLGNPIGVGTPFDYIVFSQNGLHFSPTYGEHLSKAFSQSGWIVTFTKKSNTKTMDSLYLLNHYNHSRLEFAKRK